MICRGKMERFSEKSESKAMKYTMKYHIWGIFLGGWHFLPCKFTMNPYGSPSISIWASHQVLMIQRPQAGGTYHIYGHMNCGDIPWNLGLKIRPDNMVGASNLGSWNGHWSNMSFFARTLVRIRPFFMGEKQASRCRAEDKSGIKRRCHHDIRLCGSCMMLHVDIAHDSPS